tara:strand:- start:355 stop:675 length:321 start_codon:yes stop_codon:yes gene_type:complete
MVADSFQLNFFDKVPDIGLTEIEEKQDLRQIQIIHKPSSMWRECFSGIYNGAIFNLCENIEVEDKNDIENPDVRYNNLISSWSAKGVWFWYRNKPEFILTKNIKFL